MLKGLTDRFLPSKPQFIDRIRLYQGEILSLTDVDAIVFFMAPNLQWEGPLNKAVLEKAGPKLDKHVLEYIINAQNGEVHALPGFNMPYKNLMMAILSEWDGGVDFEDRDLLHCYRNAVVQAQSMGLKSIAFPALGRDKRDFPHLRFARLALQGILEKLDGTLDEVRIVCRDKRMVDTYTERLKKSGWKPK